jgi:hypothetical protein
MKVHSAREGSIQFYGYGLLRRSASVSLRPAEWNSDAPASQLIPEHNGDHAKTNIGHFKYGSTFSFCHVCSRSS